MLIRIHSHNSEIGIPYFHRSNFYNERKQILRQCVELCESVYYIDYILKLYVLFRILFCTSVLLYSTWGSCPLIFHTLWFKWYASQRWLGVQHRQAWTKGDDFRVTPKGLVIEPIKVEAFTCKVSREDPVQIYNIRYFPYLIGGRKTEPIVDQIHRKRTRKARFCGCMMTMQIFIILIFKIYCIHGGSLQKYMISYHSILAFKMF